MEAAAAAPASHARLWGPRCSPQLAPFSGVHLGGALNPLSLCAVKQRGKKKSLASSAAADLFPVSLPASCGALTPSGCVHTASPSPLPAIRPKPSLSSQTCPPRRVSRQASWAGECCSAPSLCAGVSPFFLCASVAVGSALIAAARALLWSSFRRRSDSPLLARSETKRQEKVSCLFGSCRLFPGLPPG